MNDLKYTKIKSQDQYEEYCEILKDLLIENNEGEENIDSHVEILMLLIDTWDSEQYDGAQFDPVELILSLKEDHKLTQKKLAEIADVSPSYMSEMLNHKKYFSKKVIRNLSHHFKISQKSLNKSYSLKSVNVYIHDEVLIENLFLKPSRLKQDKKETISSESFFGFERELIPKSFSNINIEAEC